MHSVIPIKDINAYLPKKTEWDTTEVYFRVKDDSSAICTPHINKKTYLNQKVNCTILQITIELKC